jgi:hypothetical protein
MITNRPYSSAYQHSSVKYWTRIFTDLHRSVKIRANPRPRAAKAAPIIDYGDLLDWKFSH